MVTTKIGKIGLPQLFESHEKKSYFKWWMHLFLSLNKHSLLYGSFLFCYRYLVSGTISNYETLICSMYVSMWFIYCMNMFCSIFFLRFEIDWNFQTYNSEICIWLTKDWWGNFRPTIYRLSKTLFVFVERKILTDLKAVLKKSNLLVILSSTTPKKYFLVLSHWKVYDKIILISWLPLL